MNYLHFIDYAIILIVLGITLWLGFRFANRQKTTENYFLSKGNFPAWALGLSLLSTLISSVTFLGYTSQTDINTMTKLKVFISNLRPILSGYFDIFKDKHK